MAPTRRRLLTTIGAVGLGGVSLSTIRRKRAGSPTPSPSTPQPPSTVATPTDSDNGSLYSGETIPPTSHPESTAEPLIAGPLPGVDNPVLTAEDVTDFGEVTFLADPFLFMEEGTAYLFFEVYNENREDPDAAIGYAHSNDGQQWEYGEMVLEKEYHTSFPQVWKWRGDYYMCPPTGQDVELWRARSFPTDWELLGHLIDVDYYPHDPVVFRYGDRWWLFTDQGYSDVLVYYSNELETFGWTPHEENPVVSDRIEAARQGGRPVVVGGIPHLFFQDLTHEYGDKIRAYEVVELSTSTYRDREVPESPILAERGVGWNADGMHTFDPWWVGDGWVCAVDGKADGVWSIGLFRVPTEVAVDTDRVPYELAFTEGYYEPGDHEAVTVDHSGNGRNGTAYGVEFQTYDGLSGLRLVDEDARVVFACPFRTPLGSDAFTLVLYVRPDRRGKRQTLLDYGTHDKRRNLRLERTADGQWRVSATGEERTVAITGAASAGSRPTQVALTARSGEEMELYIDTARRGTGSTPGNITGSHSYLVLGADRDGTEPWQGWIGPTGVFSTALSGRELSHVDENVRQ